MQGNMIERYARLPIDSPRQIIFFVALFTLIISPFILQVEFATDVQAFLPQSEEVETYDKISEDFGRDSSVVSLYLTSVTDDNVLTIANLNDILLLHNECTKINGVKDVISVAEFFDTALIDSGHSLTDVSQEEVPWQFIHESISTANTENTNYTAYVKKILIHGPLVNA